MQSVPSTIAYCWSYFKRTLYFTLSKPTLSARCCAMALCSSVFSVWGALPVLSVLTVTCSCAEPVQGTQANHDVRQPLLCSASFSMKLTQSKSCYALKRLALQQYMTLQYSSQESLLPLLRACTSMLLLCRWSGILFMIAAVILAASQHISMIVIGRIFQGIAVSPVFFRLTCLAALHVATLQPT